MAERRSRFSNRAVTGMEIFETTIGLARTRMGLDIGVRHGAVTEMPIGDRRYEVFSFGLLYLLGCRVGGVPLDPHSQPLRTGATMLTVRSWRAATFGRATKLSVCVMSRVE